MLTLKTWQWHIVLVGQLDIEEPPRRVSYGPVCCGWPLLQLLDELVGEHAGPDR